MEPGEIEIDRVSDTVRRTRTVLQLLPERLALKGARGHPTRRIRSIAGISGLYLISCVGRQLSTSTPAKDPYTPDWFRKARAYVQGTGKPWFILAARCGIVRSSAVVDPYEKTLNVMAIAEQRNWAGRVLAEIEPHVAATRCVVILAGQHYRGFPEPAPRGRGITVVVPMAGLRIGEGLAWLGRRPHD